MRIVFLERSLGRGGAQRQLVNLAIGLAERGHDVLIALFYREGELIDEVLASKVSLYFLEKSGRWDIFLFFWRVRRMLSEFAPDLVCTFLTVPNLIALLCKGLSPRLRIVCGIRASNIDLNRYDRLTGLTYRVETLLFRFADAVISNSRTGADFAIDNGAIKTIRVIPNGIDTDRFQFRRNGRIDLRQIWNVREDDILIGLIGRFDAMKGHLIFLRAAADLAAAHTDICFAIVGDDGPIARQDLIAAADDFGLQGRVIWSKGRNDMDNVYSACDIVCSSSVFAEGFSNTLAEAMACSRRCVATDVGDARLVLGKTGHMSPPGDVGALSRSLLQAVYDCRQMGSNCFEAADRIEKNFSLATMIDSFEAEFQRVLA